MCGLRPSSASLNSRVSVRGRKCTGLSIGGQPFFRIPFFVKRSLVDSRRNRLKIPRAKTKTAGGCAASAEPSLGLGYLEAHGT